MTELLHKTALVTGSSSGVGRAIALELAAAGADLVVHARGNLAGAEETAEGARRLGRKALVLVCDFRDAASLPDFLETAWNWRGGLEILINNAGADVLTGAAAQADYLDKLELLWRVDVRATLALSRLWGAKIRQRATALGVESAPGGESAPGVEPAPGGEPAPRGAIVNIGWDQAEQGMAGDSGELFAAVKGAVMAATRSLAKSLAPHARVNCVAPGWIRTAWGERATSYWQERARRECLLERWGAPRDVAAAARFLASPAASFINGQILPVNGGFRGG